MTIPMAPEAPHQLPAYDAATDPYTADTERWLAEMDDYANRTPNVPQTEQRATPHDPALTEAAAAVGRELANHTIMRYAAGQGNDPYIPGKTAWGLVAHNGTSLHTRQALEHLADQGLVERRQPRVGRFLGRVLRRVLPTTYHMDPETAARLLFR